MNIYDVALRYLSSRSRTVWEMEKFLENKGFSSEEISHLTKDFCEYGYLDDEKYCNGYFLYAFGKGKGQRKVFAELRQKGIDDSSIERAFADFVREENHLSDERERARAEAAKVLRLADIKEGQAVPQKVAGRIARNLQSKGYGSELIYSILGELSR